MCKVTVENLSESVTGQAMVVNIELKQVYIRC